MPRATDTTSVAIVDPPLEDAHLGDREHERHEEEGHREHRGLGYALIQWQPSREQFNHGQTGWPLLGKHKGADCKKCHEPRRIVDDDAKKLFPEGWSAPRPYLRIVKQPR